MNSGLWYFAHPYTTKDKDGKFVSEGEEANFHICCWRSSQLLHAGYNIYSPIAHTHPIHRACPEFLAVYEHDIWYELDFHFIENANFKGIILSPKWETSKGCIWEKEIFEKKGLQVLYYSDIVKE